MKSTNIVFACGLTPAQFLILLELLPHEYDLWEEDDVLNLVVEDSVCIFINSNVLAEDDIEFLKEFIMDEKCIMSPVIWIGDMKTPRTYDRTYACFADMIQEIDQILRLNL